MNLNEKWSEDDVKNISQANIYRQKIEYEIRRCSFSIHFCPEKLSKCSYITKNGWFKRKNLFMNTRPAESLEKGIFSVYISWSDIHVIEIPYLCLRCISVIIISPLILMERLLVFDGKTRSQLWWKLCFKL